MEKVKSGEESIVTTLVEVTPMQLREIATQLELSAQRAYSTDTILLRFTSRIMLAFNPTVKPVEELKNKAKLNQSQVTQVNGQSPLEAAPRPLAQTTARETPLQS